MTELELCKFIERNECECRWVDEELLLWLHEFGLRDFAELAETETKDEVTCRLISNGQIVLNLVPICETYDINPLNITAEGINDSWYAHLKKIWEEWENE